MSRPKHRNAFTLIELVASAVLASMLMAGILSITWSALRESKQLQRTATHDFPPSQLIEQIRLDLQNARGMRIDSAGITLHGFVGRDPATQRPNLTLGQVRYESKDVNGHRVLSRSSDGNRWEPLWFGFGSLTIESLEEVDPDNEILPQAEAGGLPEVSARFRITMTNDQKELLWQEVIHHHDS